MLKIEPSPNSELLCYNRRGTFNLAFKAEKWGNTKADGSILLTVSHFLTLLFFLNQSVDMKSDGFGQVSIQIFDQLEKAFAETSRIGSGTFTPQQYES